MRLPDLAMGDVETFNREIVKKGYSASQVSKRLQMIKALIDRAGRPENDLQRLEWNWDSRDVLHGKPSKKRTLPSVEQLKKILRACDARERAMVWMAIGLGFGQSDLAEVCAGQIDAESYDLRRGKTGIERYGSTPPLVWKLISEYLKLNPRPDGEPLFISRRGQPLTHGKGDSRDSRKTHAPPISAGSFAASRTIAPVAAGMVLMNALTANHPSVAGLSSLVHASGTSGSRVTGHLFHPATRCETDQICRTPSVAIGSSPREAGRPWDPMVTDAQAHICRCRPRLKIVLLRDCGELL